MIRASGRHQPLYSLFSWIISPFVFSHLIWRSAHDGGWQYLRQRLGSAIPALPCEQAQGIIWLHAASVGEVHTAVPLMQQIRSTCPATTILVSTNTPTGKNAIDRQSMQRVHSVYLPLDYAFAVKRFMQRNTIHCGIIIETEIWPVLLENCAFPVVVANARLSDRTLRAVQRKHIGKFLAGIYRRAVSHLDLVLARSEVDAARFAQLGVPKDLIKTVGNLKFASTNATQTTSPAGEDRHARQTIQPDISQRAYCLLASTHEDEELQLAREWITRERSELLVIAPRHPDRRSSIIRQLESLTDSICVRSRQDKVNENTAIYLADTLGEMSLWYQDAAAIFMGGSLVPHGGHNFIEPAQYVQSVVTGPHNGNFQDEMDAFDAADAIMQVNTSAEILDALIELIDTPALAIERGKRAHGVLKANDQVADDYLSELSFILDSAK